MSAAGKQRIHVAVRGEGPNDYGEVEIGTDRAVRDGCYIAFVRRAAPAGQVECVSAGRFPKKFPGGKRKRGLPLLKGFEPHAFYGTLEAFEARANWLVIGTDTDRGLDGRRSKLAEACLERYQQLQEGHRKAAEFRPEVTSVGLVALVPMVKLESWLLADHDGFEMAAGFPRGRLPKNPEELYGQTDAKDLLDSLFRSQGRPPPGTPVKAELAHAASPSILAQQCPVSYPPFLGAVQALAETHR